LSAAEHEAQNDQNDPEPIEPPVPSPLSVLVLLPRDFSVISKALLHLKHLALKVLPILLKSSCFQFHKVVARVESGLVLAPMLTPSILAQDRQGSVVISGDSLDEYRVGDFGLEIGRPSSAHELTRDGPNECIRREAARPGRLLSLLWENLKEAGHPLVPSVFWRDMLCEEPAANTSALGVACFHRPRAGVVLAPVERAGRPPAP